MPEFKGPTPWVTIDEFEQGKVITPLALQKLCGTATKSKFRDKEGCVYRLTFKDHENSDKERYYESSFRSFADNVKKEKIEIGQQYKVTASRENYTFSFVRTGQAISATPQNPQAEISKVSNDTEKVFYGSVCTNCSLQVMTFKPVWFMDCPLCHKGLLRAESFGRADFTKTVTEYSEAVILKETEKLQEAERVRSDEARTTPQEPITSVKDLPEFDLDMNNLHNDDTQ